MNGRRPLFCEMTSIGSCVHLEPARHRGVSARSALEAVPPRDSFDGRTPYARECGARGAHLRRHCAGPDRHRAPAVGRRSVRGRREGVSLRPGSDHHRSVPVGVFVGAMSVDQGGSHIAHAARSARRHPGLPPHPAPRQLPQPTHSLSTLCALKAPCPDSAHAIAAPGPHEVDGAGIIPGGA